jgi:hypothetical protein
MAAAVQVNVLGVVRSVAEEHGGMLDQTLLNRIQDPEVRRVIELLANLYEQAMTENDTLKAESREPTA